MAWNNNPANVPPYIPNRAAPSPGLSFPNYETEDFALPEYSTGLLPGPNAVLDVINAAAGLMSPDQVADYLPTAHSLSNTLPPAPSAHLHPQVQMQQQMYLHSSQGMEGLVGTSAPPPHAALAMGQLDHGTTTSTASTLGRKSKRLRPTEIKQMESPGSPSTSAAAQRIRNHPALLTSFLATLNEVRATLREYDDPSRRSRDKGPQREAIRARFRKMREILEKIDRRVIDPHAAQAMLNTSMDASTLGTATTSTSNGTTATVQLERSSGYDAERHPFRDVGSYHLHVDGGQHGLIEAKRIAVDRNKRWKRTVVTASFAGPQRLKHPEVYASHTPTNEADQEEFDYFSTLAVDSIEDAIALVGQVLPALQGIEGVVVEVERVIASVTMFENEVQWNQLPGVDLSPGAMPVLTAVDVGFCPSKTMPFEVHFGFDVPFARAPGTPSTPATGIIRSPGTGASNGSGVDPVPPITLQLLMEECTKRGLCLGGWFMFQKESTWAFRSNMFLNLVDAEGIQRDFIAIDAILKEHGIETDLFCLVEHVLGIWTGNLEPAAGMLQNILATGPTRTEELGLWEALFFASLPDRSVASAAGASGNALQETGLQEKANFYVCTTHFLGDICSVIRSAMLSNFRRGVRYHFFLSSRSTCLRMLTFMRDLQNYYSGDVFDCVSAYVLPQEFRYRMPMECFIAQRGDQGQNRFGYKMMGNRSQHHPFPSMINSEVEDVLGKIDKVFDNLHPVDLKDMELKASSSQVFLLQTRLPSFKEVAKTGDFQYLEEMRRYENKISAKVTQHNGRVSRVLQEGFLCEFDHVTGATRCAFEIQLAMLKTKLKHYCLLDRADVSKRFSTDGVYITSGAIDQSVRALTSYQGDSGVFVTETFHTALVNKIGGQYIQKKTHELGYKLNQTRMIEGRLSMHTRLHARSAS